MGTRLVDRDAGRHRRCGSCRRRRSSWSRRHRPARCRSAPPTVAACRGGHAARPTTAARASEAAGDTGLMRLGPASVWSAGQRAAAAQVGQSPNSSTGACRSGSRSLGDLLRRRLDAAIVDVGAAAAVRADHVVVMLGLAHDVGVLARRQVDPFDQPSSGNSSRARKTVARPMPGRSAWASATRSAAEKWPDRRSTSSATARRGSVRRCPDASRVRRIGAASCGDDTQSHVEGQVRRAGRCDRVRPRWCREGRTGAIRTDGRGPGGPDRLPVRGAIVTVSVPPQSAMTGGSPWTAARLPPPRRAARSAGARRLAERDADRERTRRKATRPPWQDPTALITAGPWSSGWCW